MVDATTRGSLMRRTLDDAYNLFDDMALNAFNQQFERSLMRPVGIHSIDLQVALVAQVEALQRQLEKMNASTINHHMVSCEFYGGDHDSMNCQVSASFEQVNFLGNFQGGQNDYQRPIHNQFQIEAKIDF